jgi:hypothetical protein
MLPDADAIAQAQVARSNRIYERGSAAAQRAQDDVQRRRAADRGPLSNPLYPAPPGDTRSFDQFVNDAGEDDGD